jgi:hypothetical protein
MWWYAMDIRFDEYQREASNPSFSSLLITRTREANTFVPKPISCREGPCERPPATAYDIATAR